MFQKAHPGLQLHSARRQHCPAGRERPHGHRSVPGVGIAGRPRLHQRRQGNHHGRTRRQHLCVVDVVWHDPRRAHRPDRPRRAAVQRQRRSGQLCVDIYTCVCVCVCTDVNERTNERLWRIHYFHLFLTIFYGSSSCSFISGIVPGKLIKVRIVFALCSLNSYCFCSFQSFFLLVLTFIG